MKRHSGQLLYSPSDLVNYLRSPFSSWMDRYYLENPGAISPDVETEDEKLIALTGDQFERSVLDELKTSTANLIEIPKDDLAAARSRTISAIDAKAPTVCTRNRALKSHASRRVITKPCRAPDGIRCSSCRFNAWWMPGSSRSSRHRKNLHRFASYHGTSSCGQENRHYLKQS